MRETPDDLRRMQVLMDATHARANPHMAEIVTPERRLNAAQVAAYLQGLRHVAFGTVNARGEPRVTPLEGHFVRGWGDAVVIFRVEPVSLWAYASNPAAFPE